MTFFTYKFEYFKNDSQLNLKLYFEMTKITLFCLGLILILGQQFCLADEVFSFTVFDHKTFILFLIRNQKIMLVEK